MIREKMSVSQRAKQFMPFSALPELEDAFRKKEREHTEKLERCSLCFMPFSKIKNIEGFESVNYNDF